ncbi:hypothetical protein RBB50_011464 [Rhinocladiella similis]
MGAASIRLPCRVARSYRLEDLKPSNLPAKILFSTTEKHIVRKTIRPTQPPYQHQLGGGEAIGVLANM